MEVQLNFDDEIFRIFAFKPCQIETYEIVSALFVNFAGDFFNNFMNFLHFTEEILHKLRQKHFKSPVFRILFTLNF